MPVYLYAICRADRAECANGESLGERVRIVTSNDLAAFVSDCSGVPVASETSLWDHERIVEALMATRDLLPARFGSVLESDLAVDRVLADRRSELTDALRHVAGAVELGVRAAWTTAAGEHRPEDQPRGGLAYLRARAADQERGLQIAAELDRAVGAFVRDGRTRISAPVATLTATYLVVRSQIDRFCKRVELLRDQLPDVELTCSGPWPPYSFADPGAR
jgi:Gas vesicle synthesis protein GvpL/GvpF